MVWFSIRKKFWKALGLLYQPVVSFSQISWHFSTKQDVQENLWCLWCLLVKSLEISAWNKMCERIHGVLSWKMLLKTPQHLLHISFHAEISRDLGKNTPHCGVIVVSVNSNHNIVVSISLNSYENLISCHVTCISTNQNPPNFKISRENLRLQAIFFPFKEQSCYTALLKINSKIIFSYPIHFTQVILASLIEFWSQ